MNDLPSKKALGDVGNKQKPFSDAQESRKLLLTSCDQENSFIKPPAKTPLQKSNVVAQNNQTPNLKSAVRTPLSDIKVASLVQKPSLQNPPKSAIPKNRGRNTLLSEINAVENFINGDAEDSWWMQPDDIDAYEPIGLYNIKSKVWSTLSITPPSLSAHEYSLTEIPHCFNAGNH